MPEFGRGQSGGRENNYNYTSTSSLKNIIYLLMPGGGGLFGLCQKFLWSSGKYNSRAPKMLSCSW